MSASNAELLAQAFAGWGKDNPANMRDVLHPDCELVVPDSIPYGGTFRGVDAAVSAGSPASCGAGSTSSPRRPRALSTAAIRSSFRSTSRRGRRTARPMDVHNVWIYEFSEGKLIRGRVYADTAVLRDTVEGVTPA